MGLNRAEFLSFEHYIEAYGNIKIEKFDIENELIKLSINYVDDYTYDFICQIYNGKGNSDRIYIKLDGIGTLNTITFEVMDALNIYNDITDTKIYIDSNCNLILSSSTTTQMMDEDKNEWIFRMIMLAVTQASLARKDLSRFLQK